MAEDLHAQSYSFLRERTQYFTHGDRWFGHLPVVGCLPDEYVCPILNQGFCSFLIQNTHVQKNVISLLSRKPIPQIFYAKKCLPQ